MVEGLDHNHITRAFQDATNRGEKRQGVAHPRFFFDDRSLNPPGAVAVFNPQRALQNGKGAQNYVMRGSEGPQFAELGDGKRGERLPKLRGAIAWPILSDSAARANGSVASE